MPARSALVRAVVTPSAGACPRPDQHGSWAEGMTAGAPARSALGPSIAQSMERRGGVEGFAACFVGYHHARYRLAVTSVVL
ncbi:hypothetical protein HQ346_17485 [Rhodococcus sp. BP-252]|uniref:hypothetical protein n=1 Tax=Nocardiaceae TaxID=85025 RepID=UPI0012EE2922|nr:MULTISPECIES: hypothetical protein [Rhodococcus]MBY6413492.1 hypothetical protein [Rhodococcus sp. BP-320]MBY6418186.1 hypothetical protein [Rhodococcus sp. BP-321]MBY6422333.1 hypothetical protein [Rhodococcus sp. BP-324]MBY6428686.1 hypothetical protein [Rhodococcus sp. BP-323]MBY6433692.1 hypothetical protein [Rhodococcus sp. BP-322]